MIRTNEWQQPIGPAMPGWLPCYRPWRMTIEGRYCRLEPLEPSLHGDDLYAAHSMAPDGRVWTYLFSGPFADRVSFDAYLESAAASTDPLHFAVIDAVTDRAVGTLALLRIVPEHGVIEVGGVTFSPLLQRTRAATEAHFLLMRLAFETLGYRRYEWKCDSLNAPSRAAAVRLGFSYEGLFRQTIVYKGRSRDTAWFSVIDREWPRIKAAFNAWLAPENFDEEGRQRLSLSEVRQQLPA